MDEQISIKDANKFVRKSFQTLMKHYNFLKNKRTGFYFRIRESFIQIFILRFLRSIPQIECLLTPAFLYTNGNLPYMVARYANLENKIVPGSSLFFSDIISPQGYSRERFDHIWEANRRALEQILLPYLNELDFIKTLGIFQAGKNEYFQVRMGAYDYVSYAVAVGLLKCSSYEDGYERLLTVRDIYAQAVGPSSESIFLFEKNLSYIDDLLFLLQNKPDQWEDKISERIAKTEFETSLLWTEN